MAGIVERSFSPSFQSPIPNPQSLIPNPSFQAFPQPAHAFSQRNPRLVAEVISGTADVEVVRSGEFRRQKPAQRRLARERKNAINEIPEGANEPRGWGRDAAADGGQTGQGENFVDPCPGVDRFALADEVCPAGYRRAWPKGVGRQQVGLGGVLDIDRVDSIRAVADAAQPAATAIGQTARNQVPVARTPNQVRPQREQSRCPRPLAASTCCSASAFERG